MSSIKETEIVSAPKSEPELLLEKFKAKTESEVSPTYKERMDYYIACFSSAIKLAKDAGLEVKEVKFQEAGDFENNAFEYIKKYVASVYTYYVDDVAIAARKTNHAEFLNNRDNPRGNTAIHRYDSFHRDTSIYMQLKTATEISSIVKNGMEHFAKKVDGSALIIYSHNHDNKIGTNSIERFMMIASIAQGKGKEILSRQILLQVNEGLRNLAEKGEEVIDSKLANLLTRLMFISPGVAFENIGEITKILESKIDTTKVPKSRGLIKYFTSEYPKVSKAVELDVTGALRELYPSLKEEDLSMVRTLVTPTALAVVIPAYLRGKVSDSSPTWAGIYPSGKKVLGVSFMFIVETDNKATERTVIRHEGQHDINANVYRKKGEDESLAIPKVSVKKFFLDVFKKRKKEIIKPEEKLKINNRRFLDELSAWLSESNTNVGIPEIKNILSTLPSYSYFARNRGWSEVLTSAQKTPTGEYSKIILKHEEFRNAIYSAVGTAIVFYGIDRNELAQILTSTEPEKVVNAIQERLSVVDTSHEGLGTTFELPPPLVSTGESDLPRVGLNAYTADLVSALLATREDRNSTVLGTYNAANSEILRLIDNPLFSNAYSMLKGQWDLLFQAFPNIDQTRFLQLFSPLTATTNLVIKEPNLKNYAENPALLGKLADLIGNYQRTLKSIVLEERGQVDLSVTKRLRDYLELFLILNAMASPIDRRKYAKILPKIRQGLSLSINGFWDKGDDKVVLDQLQDSYAIAPGQYLSSVKFDRAVLAALALFKTTP